VTLAFALTRHLPAREAVSYIGAQLLGAIAAAALLLAIWPSEPAALGTTLPTAGVGSAFAHGERVHPEVVAAMAELGIDLSARVPRKLSQGDAEWADVVVTMGCGDECPYIPGKRYVDWDLPDPRPRPLEEVRRSREEIERRVSVLVAELDGEEPT
jgi:arsenate reductase (thioredoxin)